ncbi:MAG TPA: hypothetical protein GXZ89_01675 [Fastidiosipila sp.]|nr:hypothetical protein [Fastidiosipila sp.]
MAAYLLVVFAWRFSYLSNPFDLPGDYYIVQVGTRTSAQPIGSVTERIYYGENPPAMDITRYEEGYNLLREIIQHIQEQKDVILIRPFSWAMEQSNTVFVFDPGNYYGADIFSEPYPERDRLDESRAGRIIALDNRLNHLLAKDDHINIRQNEYEISSYLPSSSSFFRHQKEARYVMSFEHGIPEVAGVYYFYSKNEEVVSRLASMFSTMEPVNVIDQSIALSPANMAATFARDSKQYGMLLLSLGMSYLIILIIVWNAYGSLKRDVIIRRRLGASRKLLFARFHVIHTTIPSVIATILGFLVGAFYAYFWLDLDTYAIAIAWRFLALGLLLSLFLNLFASASLFSLRPEVREELA